MESFGAIVNIPDQWYEPNLVTWRDVTKFRASHWLKKVAFAQKSLSKNETFNLNANNKIHDRRIRKFNIDFITNKN